jgi:hypothetical protein
MVAALLASSLHAIITGYARLDWVGFLILAAGLVRIDRASAAVRGVARGDRRPIRDRPLPASQKK